MLICKLFKRFKLIFYLNINIFALSFEAAVKNQKMGGAPAPAGVKILGASLARIRFTFCGVEFSFNPLLPVIGGIVIAAVAAFLGVGGGFMLVPFLTSITQLPMYLAAGTSALAVLVSMITSIVTLMTKGVPVDWALVGTEMVDIAMDSLILYIYFFPTALNLA